MKNNLIYILILGAVLLTRCGSKNNPTTVSGVQPTFSSLYSNVFSKNCIQCHEPQGSATVNNGTTLDFSTQGMAYTTLTSGTSVGSFSNNNGECHSVPFIVSSQPTSSYMLATLISDYTHSDFYNVGCTPYSPSAHGATLDSADETALVQWIQNGALNN